MVIKNYNAYFLILFLVILGALTFFIFKPFLSAIIFAGVLAVAFQRPYNFFLRITGKKEILSSLLTIILVALVVIIPISIVIGIIANEVITLYTSYFKDDASVQLYVQNWVNSFNHLPIVSQFNSTGAFEPKEFSGALENVFQGAFSVAQTFYQKTAQFIFWILATFFALFYFLIDGRAGVEKLIKLSPIKDSHELILLNRFVSIVNALLKGVFIVGIVQGTLGGIAFAIAGVPSPVTWGFVMFIFSLIPMFGSAIVWLPASIVLILVGHIWEGLFLLIFGMIIISTIDNVIKPKLVGSETQIHPFLIFFSTLGGIIMFGIVGVLIGPIILALFVALLEIYSIEFKGQLDDFNA